MILALRGLCWVPLFTETTIDIYIYTHIYIQPQIKALRSFKVNHLWPRAGNCGIAQGLQEECRYKQVLIRCDIALRRFVRFSSNLLYKIIRSES